MNKVIILSELAKTVAELTQCSVEDAENFVRETFRLAAERLEADRRVEIPGLGTFLVADETIEFAPDSAFAAELNAPFAAFEAIELPEDFEPEVKTAENVEEEEEIAAAAEFEEAEDAAPLPPEYHAEAEVPEEPAEPQESKEPKEPKEPEEPEEPQAAVVVKKQSRGYVHWLWAAACIACFALGWFARDFVPQPINDIEIPEVTDTIAVEEPEAADSVPAEVIPVPEPKVIYDTITATRFLTTMARAHYGQMEYWVYIYEANADKLGHPDRLSAGTVVAIPALDFDPTDSARIDLAKRKATEIYGRFN